ncbi:CocE/NonD family hydrolase C-terminal non-catalytic domain-containing protein [Haladaptatus sp. DFWS20]|uniref:CocE/NonD family hydrolase C-terminal non-catalytic domain-containing protein n=1 Tax=Haladaptatus sp. DFWS20 TaxID=3403467 RepID=UPI003EB80158
MSTSWIPASLGAGAYQFEISPLIPEEVYAWKIAVWPTARVFEAGHRLEVSSSNFPQ